MKRLFSVLMSVFLLVVLVACEDLPSDVSTDAYSYIESSDELSYALQEDSSDLSDEPAFALPDSGNDESSADADESDSGVIEGSEISVVVLGDSIARGYGLEDAETERFSALLSEKLKTRYETVNMSNYGIDGLDGAGLITLLKTEMPEDMSSADTVIISIGANNILGPMSEFEGWRIISGGIDPKIFVDYFKFLFSKDESKKDAYDYAVKSLDILFKTVNQVFGGDAFKSLTQNAALKLTREIPEMIALIRAENPDADIYIQTVYNPYDGLELSFHGVEETLDLSFVGEFSVAPINTVIESLADSYGYTVAPVWEVFEASSQSLTNAGFNLLSADFGVDPHPNAKGHELMADIYYKLLTEE